MAGNSKSLYTHSFFYADWYDSTVEHWLFGSCDFKDFTNSCKFPKIYLGLIWRYSKCADNQNMATESKLSSFYQWGWDLQTFPHKMGLEWNRLDHIPTEFHSCTSRGTYIFSLIHPALKVLNNTFLFLLKKEIIIRCSFSIVMSVIWKHFN